MEDQINDDEINLVAQEEIVFAVENQTQCNSDLCTALVAADIPLNKLNNEELNHF